MTFLKSSFSYLLKLSLVGMALRFCVALYIGLWSLSSPSSIFETLQPFWYGWHFDLAMAAFLYFLLYGSLVLFNYSKGKFKTFNGLLFFLYVLFVVADALYMKESGRHISYEVYNLVTIESSLGGLLMKYWLPVLLVFIGTALARSFVKAGYAPVKNIFLRVPAFLFVTAISLVFCRGFDGIPQDPSWAYKAGGGSTGASLALNGSYGIVWAIFSGKKSSKENITVPSEVPTAQIFEKWKSLRGINNPSGNFDGNIVIVFLEGWSGILTDMSEDGKPLLPFFNQLQQTSLRPELMLAGGHRTSEGLFASLCGLPNPLGKSIMFSEIENKDFTCLPQLLGKKGYSSAFFQGSDQNTSGVGLLTLKTGFQNSYGKKEIPDWENLDRNTWGVFDHDLYKFAQSKMDQMQEPMLIGINTNSTHDNVLPKGVNTELKKLAEFKHFHYADSELADFYQSLTKRKWKKDWVLVLIADHTTYANSFFEHYYLPFLMKYHSVSGNSPAKPFKEELVSGVFHQNDVATTLADLTGTKAPTFLGRSLLHPEKYSEGASIFHLGESAWFEGPWSVVSNIRKYGEKKCYRWKEDKTFAHALPCPDTAEQMYLNSLSFVKESQEYLFK
ncbi:LTA synthase family protein [Bdellovibrio svalbardensis]|uniref:LTA synthase family protein n=1 Tax=Bdellovibrio svalbardensis TaxID=2972972 RepID=A0ABT6DKI1_9BACT|nr:LTA synthase family protein [Bdellovibrio svalbardensis]MDG0817365.1 LTA synthase family protein [Bdellovibrio svalbardensis]